MKSIVCSILALVTFSSVLHGDFQEQDKYKVNPTPDPTSKYKIYVPTNLERIRDSRADRGSVQRDECRGGDAEWICAAVFPKWRADDAEWEQLGRDGEPADAHPGKFIRRRL